MAASSDSQWVNVAVETAKRHPLYGVGGWLWVVALGAVLSPIIILATAAPLYLTIDYAAIHAALTAFIMAEIAFNALVALWSIGNLFLLFSKHRWFPTSYISFLAFTAVLTPLDAVVAKAILDSIGQPMSWAETFDPSTAREVGRSIIGALIWIPYTLVSRRVNVTFLNRVRANDPALGEKAADVF